VTATAALRLQLSLNDDEADDDFLTGRIAAAEAYTTAMIGAETPVAYGDAPADLQLAILMLAAHWYENREATLVGISADELPFGYEALVASHRKWVF